MRLPPEIEAAGYRLLVLDETGSTNEDAAKAARRGDPGLLWIAARRQTSGRGRNGRAWSSPPGNLSASLLLVDSCAPAIAPQLGFLAGIALHEAVEAVTGLGSPRLALKWPNDLLLDGAKVSGLLLEGQILPGGGFAVAVGIGVNVASAPEETPYPAAALAGACPSLTVDAVFAELALRIGRRLAAWLPVAAEPPQQAFAGLRRAWLRRAAGVGGEITVRLPSGPRPGRFRGLDPLGRLELETSAGVELIDAGDLYFAGLRTTSDQNQQDIHGVR